MKSSDSNLVVESAYYGDGFLVTSSQVVVLALSSIGAFPVAAGTPVTWTTTATGGAPPLQYQFWHYTPAAGWVVARAYSSDPTFSWTPTPQDVGTNQFAVWVRSSGSSSDVEAAFYSSGFQILP